MMQGDGDTTRLLIADASTALRIGLRMIFGLDSSIEISAEAASADELQNQAFETQPHVVVFDADMPGIDAGHSIYHSRTPKVPADRTYDANQRSVSIPHIEYRRHRVH